MSKPGTRFVVFAARGTVIGGVASLFFLLLTPDAATLIQQLPALLLLIIGFLVGFTWQHGQLDHYHGESERNESKEAVYTLGNFFVVGSKIYLITFILSGLIPLILLRFFGQEGFGLILTILLVIVFIGAIGVTSAILLWERRRHLRVYSRKIGAKQWLIYFTSTKNI